MRVFTVLIALVATPFIMSVAQNPRARPDQPDGGGNQCVQEGQNEGGDCVPTPPPPPPPPPNSASISGMVFGDPNANGVLDPGELGIEGWLITITGPVNTTIATDVLGNFSFTSLPAGAYTVCQASKFPFNFQSVPVAGPTCPFGLGYDVTVVDGQAVTGLLFGDF